MKQTTKKQLNEINKLFYQVHAIDFHQTRGYSWQGWERMANKLKEEFKRKSISVLDVGCGNGRLAVMLSDHFTQPIKYTGIDFSSELLRRAKRRLENIVGIEQTSLILADIVTGGLNNLVAEQRFDLISIFGVFHHIPSFEGRGELMQQAEKLLSKNGYLAVSFWEFLKQKRFKDKIVSWEEYNLTHSKPIEIQDLEDGDFLLTFNRDRKQPRYCHCSSNEEQKELIGSLKETSLLDEYTADGKDDNLNRYYILKSIYRE